MSAVNFYGLVVEAPAARWREGECEVFAIDKEVLAVAIADSIQTVPAGCWETIRHRFLVTKSHREEADETLKAFCKAHGFDYVKPRWRLCCTASASLKESEG